MPKSAKKRREKAADFSKAKLKLGKGKKLPSNAIDTSFKARSIALPTQTIAIEKDGSAPTTKRKLTFDDLIAHMKHYSPGTRKDAILGMRELLDGHPDLINSSLTTLFGACVRLIGDEDASVRKTLLSFFSWLFPRVPTDDLIPHSPLLLLFTTSAQTHIFPEIRVDAIRFLDLFLDTIPNTITSGWDSRNDGHGSRVLEGYLGILNAGTKFGDFEGAVHATSTASVVLSSASKLVVLKSLSVFLKSASSLHHNHISGKGVPSTTWFFSSTFSTPAAFDTFVRLLPSDDPSKASIPEKFWESKVDCDSYDEDFVPFSDTTSSEVDVSWTLRDLSETAEILDDSFDLQPHSSNVTFASHLSRTLHSTMISTFLDCAPIVFSPSSTPPETEVQLVLAVAEIARSLFTMIFQGRTSRQSGTTATIEELQDILGYMTNYFPFGSNGSRDMKLELAFQDLNIIFCELTSLLVLTTAHDTNKKSRGVKVLPHRIQGVLTVQTDRVSKYVVQLLSGDSSAFAQISRPIAAGAYVELLPTIWSLLNNPSLDHHLSENIFETMIGHALKVPSTSALKKPTLDFISRLVLLETERQYQGQFQIGRRADWEKKINDWIVHLPQTLWELGGSHLSSTETILRFLLRFFQRKSPTAHKEVIMSIRSRLVPYFIMKHPVRGEVLGPYSKMPIKSPLRRLSLDVVIILCSLGSDATLIGAINKAVSGTDEEAYWGQLKASVLRI